MASFPRFLSGHLSTVSEELPHRRPFPKLRADFLWVSGGAAVVLLVLAWAVVSHR